MVDDGDVALLPQEAAKRLCGTNEEKIVKLVEVPLVDADANPSQSEGEASDEKEVGTAGIRVDLSRIGGQK